MKGAGGRGGSVRAGGGGACFERIPHTADVGVRVRGRDAADLFANAARAMFAVMVSTAPGVRGHRRGPSPAPGPAADGGRVAVGADDLPGLMQAWLSELLYRFAAEKRVGTAFEIRSIGRPAAGAPFRLEAVVREEPFDPRRHAVEAEIKAVTFHQLRVAERPRGGWEAQMIFDV